VCFVVCWCCYLSVYDDAVLVGGSSVVTNIYILLEQLS